MANRITGLATGLDIDELVKTTMQAYKTKVDTKKQQKSVLEIKQQLYRDVIKEGQDFYNKYFDLAKTGNLLTSNSYTSIKFTSSDESVVSATATSTAIKDNYKFDVKSLATTASTKLTSDQLSSDLEITSADGKSVLIKASELDGKSEKEQAKYINSKISSLGLKASTTDFSSGITIETEKTGSDQSFTISSGAIIDAHLKDTEATITADTVEFSLEDLVSENAKDIEFKLDGKSVIIKASDLKSSISSHDTKIENLNKELEELKNADTLDEEAIKKKEEEIDSATKARSTALASTLSSKLSSAGLKAEFNEEGNRINVVTKTGEESFEYTKGTAVDAAMGGGSSKTEINNGTDLKAIITNSKGTIAYGYKEGDADIPANAKILSGTSNTITLDGVSFTINSVGESKVTGKVDGTELKDKLVSFINDYNNLVTNLNKLTTETRYRDYDPLTDDQKSEMTEKEIELWEAKVKSGQLRNDSDLTRIVNNLKSSMSSLVEGAGTTLEKMGITPVQDYSGTTNGTFTIDEDALLKAIEEDAESVMNVFIQKGDSSSNTGILHRMKDILNDEFVSTTKSALIKKAGVEGTASFSQNTLTKQISQYERKIEEMEDALEDKEQALYSKWASIETMMNNYNSQMSYLYSMFGTSS